MPLVYCRTPHGNFGDDLNAILWQSIFPDIEQLSTGIGINGIGTILSKKSSLMMRTVVLGSGADRPNIEVNAKDSDIRWVRGPRSARAVGVAPDLGLGDPAWLHADLYMAFEHRANAPIGLMPHHASWETYDWEKVAGDAGMIAIDPRMAPAQVIARMRSCSRILSESLHGAVFADAMGLPWAPAILAHRFHRFKWEDWTASINRKFNPFMPDRALVSEIGAARALKNRIARAIAYQASARCPAMRAVRAARPDDAEQVSAQLFAYGAGASNFSHSRIEFVKARRDRMLEICAAFAKDYGLSMASDAAAGSRQFPANIRSRPKFEWAGEQNIVRPAFG
ncbi:hypothetical protein D9O50_16455 [Oxalobacteraceae bacterium CAVE-383]|nr:hypothetical protein D9O50_16455 [Oxalobacteraceae bacterium CAVE-383]